MRVLLYTFLIAGLASAASAADLPAPCADFSAPNADPHGCDAAIAAETDPEKKSMLLYRRAFIQDASGHYDQYQSAMIDLSEAIRLSPQNWRALQERGYLENELGDAEKAEADLDAEYRIFPNNAGLYQERALARFRRGNLQGYYEDRDRQTVLEPNSAPTRAARAEALMWLGSFAEAAKDIDAAALLAKATNDVDTLDWTQRLRAALARWQAWDDPVHALAACTQVTDGSDYEKPGFIGNCTRAFLDARTDKDRSDALTQRATALQLWRQQPSAGLDDARLAAAFNPTASTLGNLGSWLESNGLHHEALRNLDRSIALEPNAYSLATRAAVKYNLGDANGAFADSKKSFEMNPNEVALTVLGDLLYDKHDIAAAKTYWTSAYHLGDRDDGLKARLAKIGVAWPPSDDASPPK